MPTTVKRYLFAGPQAVDSARGFGAILTLDRRLHRQLESL